MAISEAFQTSATISTTEYFLTANSTTQSVRTTDGVYAVFLDCSAVADGDLFRVRMYEKVSSGGTLRVCLEEYIRSGDSLVALPPVMFLHGWDVSLTKISGTDRSIAWSIRSVGTATETFQSSVSVSTTEYFLAAASTTQGAGQSTDYATQLWLDLNAMVAGDHFRLRCYEKVASGGTARSFYEVNYYGVQAVPLVFLPTFVGMHGWDYSLLNVAGSARTLIWSIRRAGA